MDSAASFVFVDPTWRLDDLAVSTYRESPREVIAAPKQVVAQSPLHLSSLVGVETIFNWLYKLPDTGIALLFGMVGACLLAGAPFLRERSDLSRALQRDHTRP